MVFRRDLSLLTTEYGIIRAILPNDLHIDKHTGLFIASTESCFAAMVIKIITMLKKRSRRFFETGSRQVPPPHHIK